MRRRASGKLQRRRILGELHRGRCRRRRRLLHRHRRSSARRGVVDVAAWERLIGRVASARLVIQAITLHSPMIYYNPCDLNMLIDSFTWMRGPAIVFRKPLVNLANL